MKSDTTKTFTAYGFLKVDCTLQISRSNNKPDRDSFVKNASVGDGNGTKSKISNQRLATKITHILSPKVIKLS